MNENIIVVKNKEEYSQVCSEIIIDFLKTASLKERHKFVSGWNHDASSRILEWVIRDSNTDKATILMLYWRISPGYNKQFVNRNEVAKKASWHLEQFDLFEETERLILSNSYNNQQIAYDPTNDMGYDWTNEISNYNLKKKIPDEMFTKLKGDIVLEDENWAEGLPPHIYEEINSVVIKRNIP